MDDLSYFAEQIKQLIEEGWHIEESKSTQLLYQIARLQGLLSDDGEIIEPVPEGIFKIMTVAHFPPTEAQAIFFTSGTTSTKGKHLIKDLELYRLSVVEGFRRFVMYEPHPTVIISLIPPGIQRPNSSLSYMVSFVGETFGKKGFYYISKREELVPLLEKMMTCNEPVIIFGTTLNFLALVDTIKTPIRMPNGSRIIHTGGSKASGIDIDKQILTIRLSELFGIEQSDVIEEYGMTELLSQAYKSPRITLDTFVSVPWMKTMVVDPLTMEEVQEGERGILLHYDLANVYTAVAILTYDMAYKKGQGFDQIDRAPNAPLRGCSFRE